MCVPIAVALAGTAIATSLAGTAVSIAGSTQAANAAEDRAKYEERIAQYNAISLKNAGRVEQVKQGLKQRREFATARALASGSAFDLSYGSTARRLDETRRFHAFDGVLLARNIQAKVLGATMSGEAARYNGKVLQSNLQWQAATSGIEGAASVAGSLYDFNRAGIVESAETPSSRRANDYGPTSSRYTDPWGAG